MTVETIEVVGTGEVHVIETLSGGGLANEYARSLTYLQSIAAGSSLTMFLLGRTDIGAGGHGWYFWNENDLSTEVAADEVTPGQGDGYRYIAPASDRTGASGAYVRYDSLTKLSYFNGSLAAAVDHWGSTPVTLEIDCASTIASGASVSTPATMTLRFTRQGSVTGDATASLMISGQVEKGTEQSFSGGIVVSGTYALLGTPSVPTIAALRALPAPGISGFAVSVRGYYTPGDGGGGPVRIWSASSTATDNGGSVIKPTAIDAADPGRWVWEWGGDYNALWFDTLANADAAAVAATRTLVISTTWSTVPATFSSNVYMTTGGKLNNAGVITFVGSFDADVSEHFIGAGAVNGIKRGYVEWFGAVSDGSDVSAEIQKAVTAIAGNNGTIIFSGSYKISTPIVWPNTSWKAIGEGGPTRVSITETAGSIILFDVPGNGPLKIIDGIAFYAPTVGVYAGTGVNAVGANGLLIQNCWFSGLTTGVNVSNSSLINISASAFEFNVLGISFAGSKESIVDRIIFYKNLTDFYGTGDLGTFQGSAWNHTETITDAILLTDATNSNFFDISADAGGSLATPKIIRMTGASSYNSFTGVKSIGFGSNLVAMPTGSTCTHNLFTGLVGKGMSGAMIELGGGNTLNRFTDFISDGNAHGVLDVSGSNIFSDFTIINSTTSGIFLIANTGGDNYTYRNGYMRTNVADWSTAGTPPTVWLSNVDSDMSGFVATRVGIGGGGHGQREFITGAVPASLAYIVGDHARNAAPAAGQPKGWYCTVSGTPGTWVSEGNL